MRELLLIAALTLIFVVAFYTIGGAMSEKEGGEVESPTLKVYDALSEVSPPQQYHLVALQRIEGPNLSINRTLHIWKNTSSLVVKLEDPDTLLNIWYINENESERLCLNFTTPVCSDASALPVYANSLKREEVSRFLATYSAQVHLLESKGALKLLSVEEGTECKNELEFTYSFGDLPVKDLQEASIFLSAEALKTTYKSRLCLEDGYVKLFTKEYNNSAGNFYEESRVVLFEEGNITVPDVSGEEKPPEVFRAYYEEYQNFYKELIKADDPQLRSLAKQYRLPALCSKAKDSDFCYLTYAQSTEDFNACENISNETLREECLLPSQSGTEEGNE